MGCKGSQVRILSPRPILQKLVLLYIDAVAALILRTDPMKTLFLHPPSFDGFDGGAGARYQMKREVRSYWYPTWLAQPAALVEGSKLIDAPPHGLKFEDLIPEIKGRDLVVMHTSTPSFQSDVKTAEMIKALNPDIKIGFIG